MLKYILDQRLQRRRPKLGQMIELKSRLIRWMMKPGRFGPVEIVAVQGLLMAIPEVGLVAGPWTAMSD